MILGILLLAGGLALVVLAFRHLGAARDPNWVRADDTRLVVGPQPGSDEPRVALWRGEGIAFGPCAATWQPPAWMAGVPAPVTGSAGYRVATAIDLGAEDAFGTGDARLAAMLRDAIGPGALLLLPDSGDRPVLLHGTASVANGSAGGIAVEQAQFGALAALLGDAAGLRVQVVRRRVQRAGWGAAQGQRQRGRQ